jgi:hypothetical protein
MEEDDLVKMEKGDIGKWEEFLSWELNRILLLLVIQATVAQVCVWALCAQETGSIPFVREINLLVFRLETLPLSRLWDLFLGPIFLFLVYKVENAEAFSDIDEMGRIDVGVTNELGTLVFFGLVGGWLGGSACGVWYAIPFFFVGLCLYFLFVIFFVCAMFCLGER